jgi:DUF4097 and DUF4098 domain-containing protein YvlB
MMVRRLLCSIGFCMAILVATGCDVVNLQAQASSEGMFDRTLTVSGPVSLDVRTGSGNIQIRIGASDSVRVIGRIRARTFFFDDDPATRVAKIQSQPPIEQTGATIRIGHHAGDDQLYRNVRISYEITVPPNTQVRSQSGSGDQMIGNVRAVEARTGSGDIEIAQAAGDVQAATGSGDIDVDRAGGNLVATTGSGDIHASAVGGALKARTGSGNVEVTQVDRAEVEVRTGSGDVAVGLDSNAAFNLSARTGSGSIKTTHPLTVTGEVSRRRLQGAVRGGGANVSITTGSGSILIQ